MALVEAKRRSDSPYCKLGVNLSSVTALIDYYQSDRTWFAS